MDRRYKHLNGEERGVILAEHRRGASLREIGGLLGRAPSTIGPGTAAWQSGGGESRPSPIARSVAVPDTDLSAISQTELNDVARLMNQRPRKTLGWKTPEKAMAEELAAFRSTVALET